MKGDKKDYTKYIFFLTYYGSFILLLFEITSGMPQMNDLKKIFVNVNKLYLALTVVSIIFLTVIFLFYYFILKAFIKDNSNDENIIAIPILLTDSFLSVAALLLSILCKNIINIIPIINMIIGPILFYFLVKDRLSKRDAVVATIIKFAFYLMNLPLLFH